MTHFTRPGAIASAITATRLFDSTLGADTATIDTGANGVSQLYDHLLLVLLLRTTEAVTLSGVNMTFNGDGGANYDRQVIRNTNTTVIGAISLAQTSFTILAPGASAQTGAFSAPAIFIPSYAQTNAHKAFDFTQASIEDTAADCRIESAAGRWRSTSAISRVALTAQSGNLLAGSRMSIYGL